MPGGGTIGGVADGIGGVVVSAAGALGAGGGTATGPPEGGARLTAAPGSGTAAGGTGGGRSLNHCALAGAVVTGSSISANASQSRMPRRNPEMPPPRDVIALLFTENAANSSLAATVAGQTG